MINYCDNDNVIKKINFDIKFHQKQGKPSFSIIFINFHIICDPKRSKNGLKRSKNDQI